MKDLDGEVFTLLTKDLLGFLFEDLACPVVGVDDVVIDLELDVLDLPRRLEALELLFGFVWNGALLLPANGRFCGRWARSAGIGPRG